MIFTQLQSSPHEDSNITFKGFQKVYLICCKSTLVYIILIRGLII